MIRRPPRSTQSRSSAASDVYKRQLVTHAELYDGGALTGHRLTERVAGTLNIRGMNEADRRNVDQLFRSVAERLLVRGRREDEAPHRIEHRDHVVRVLDHDAVELAAAQKLFFGELARAQI